MKRKMKVKKYHSKVKSKNEKVKTGKKPRNNQTQGLGSAKSKRKQGK
jgi:hypothetical protein